MKREKITEKRENYERTTKKDEIYFTIFDQKSKSRSFNFSNNSPRDTPMLF